MHCFGERKLVQPVLKTVWRFLKKIKLEYHVIQQLHFWSYSKKKPYVFLKIFIYLFNLFIYLFLLCWVLVSVRGLSLVAASGGHSLLRCTGLPLTVAASLVAEHRLQTRRLSSRGSGAQLLRGMWDLPRPGLEPVSPALAGRFSITAPPGKPKHRY